MSVQPNVNILKLFPLFLVLIIDAMGFGIIFPLIGPLFLVPGQGLFAADIAMSTREIFYGLSVSCFFVFILIGSPFIGDLSDKLGRKKIILICLFGTGVAYLLSVVSIQVSSISLFLFARCLAGFLAGSQSIAQAAIIDISTPETKVKNLAFMTLAGCLGFSIGPLLGGFFSSSEYFAWMNNTTPFMIAALLAFANAVGLIFLFEETHIVEKIQRLEVSKVLTMLKRAWVDPRVRIVSLLFLVMQLGWGLYYQYISLYLVEELNYGGMKLGLFNTSVGVLFSITLVFLIRLLLRLMSVKQLTIASLIIQGSVTIMYFFYTKEVSLWLLLIPLTLAVGLAYTCLLTLYSDCVSSEHQGWVMGVSEAVMAIAWIVASVFVATSSLLPHGGIFWIAGGLPLVGALVYHSLRSKTHLFS